MEPPERSAGDRPLVFCLHYLAGSAREWAPVADLLESVRCVALDLPGFGDAADTPGYAVAEMAAYVARAIRGHASRRWFLAGHSMGAKVATVLARYAEDGAPELAGFAGLVLLAGSPPGPEPMDEKRRHTMLGWFCGDADANRADARNYVAQNSATLDPVSGERATQDALRANGAAWKAWLEHGSREDWSDRIGTLQTPALIIAGENDADLGPSAQTKLMAPHFARVRSLTLAGAKHLLPLERPHEVARLIAEYVAAVVQARDRRQGVSAAYRDLINSERVSGNTRLALLERGRPDDAAYRPVAMDAAAFATLRAVVGRVLPQEGTPRIDLAARIDAELASGVGDGWRFAQLPPDAPAYRAALRTLNEAARVRFERDFAELAPRIADDLLTAIAGGSLGSEGEAGGSASAERLSATQMRAWFEDLRADAVGTYMGHPETLARMGYSGIAYGGDGEPKSGFARIGLGEREAWEPVAAADLEL